MPLPGVADLGTEWRRGAGGGASHPSRLAALLRSGEQGGEGRPPRASVVRGAGGVQLVGAADAAGAGAAVAQVAGPAGQAELGGAAAGAGVGPAGAALLLQGQAELLQLQVVLGQALLQALQAGQLAQAGGHLVAQHLRRVVAEELPVARQALGLQPVLVQEAAQVAQLAVLGLQPPVDGLQLADLAEVLLQLPVDALDEAAALHQRRQLLGLLVAQAAHQLLLAAAAQLGVAQLARRVPRRRQRRRLRALRAASRRAGLAGREHRRQAHRGRRLLRGALTSSRGAAAAAAASCLRRAQLQRRLSALLLPRDNGTRGREAARGDARKAGALAVANARVKRCLPDLLRILWGELCQNTMTNNLDIFVGNTTLIDEEVYQLWLDGYTVNDAVSRRLRSGILEQTGATVDVLQSDTMDHYRTFYMLERLLHSPPKLLNQLLFQIPPYRQTMLIERYYAFDEAFVREVLGKKLSKGTKKDLDDISIKTGVTLKSCRRQFDNFKRVFKAVEELRGSLVENIQQHFLLSDRLARDYAAIVFFANSRFETGKKKLQYLTFEDFAYCAQQMIQNWTLGAMDTSVDNMDVDLDKEFLQGLKELKILIADKDLLDMHKSLVCTSLRGKISVYSEMETNFKNLSRALINIASKLTHSKDVRDFFVDLVEKFVEPFRSDKWSPEDVRLFLTQYTACAHMLDAFRYQTLWERYMSTIQACLLKMYHD